MADEYDFGLRRGATWRQAFEWRQADGTTPYDDLTGWTAAMQLRTRAESGEALLSLTSPAGGLAIDGPAARITATITAAQSADLPVGRAAYDIRLTAPSGDVYFLVEGTVTVESQVTR